MNGEATLTTEELEAMYPSDPDGGFREPDCWGFNSYEHYKGVCKHHAEEEYMADAMLGEALAEAAAEAMSEYYAGEF